MGAGGDGGDLPKLHVAVLMGGWASERPVSLMSGDGVADALEARGHRVTRIDMDREVALRLAETKPDVVFNALHGVPGEDGTVQGMMDLMGVPYTHSGLPTSVIAIDKELTKHALVPHGIPMPGGRIVKSEELVRRRSAGAALCAEAGQRGLLGRRRDRHCREAITATRSAATSKGPWQRFESLLAEPYIRGRELTAAVLGDRALLVTELVPKSGLLRFRRQVHRRHDRARVPGANPATRSTACASNTRSRRTACSAAAGPAARTSAGTTSAGVEGLFLLETNTQPGMTPLSLVPEQARHCGIEYAELVEIIVEDALAHAGKLPRRRRRR